MMIPTNDPYPTYRTLREQHPMYWDNDLDAFLVSWAGGRRGHH